MARKRLISPNFNDDDDICALSPWARLLYIGLWGHLDKQGLIEDSPRSLRSRVFPREDHPMPEVEGWRDELLRPGPSGRSRLIRIQWQGKTLLYCPTLSKHQRIYADEAARFNVPQAELDRAQEEASKPCRTVAAGDPRGTPAEGARDPRMSHGSSSSSAPAPASAKLSLPAPAPASAQTPRIASTLTLVKPIGGTGSAIGTRIGDRLAPFGIGAGNGDEKREKNAIDPNPLVRGQIDAILGTYLSRFGPPPGARLPGGAA